MAATRTVAGAFGSRPRAGHALDGALAVIAFAGTLAITAHGQSSTGTALGYPGGPPLGATITLYLIATSRDAQHPWDRGLTELVVALFLVHIGAFAFGHGGQLPALQLAIGALVWALAWFAGDRTRLRRHEVAQLRLRALQAERDAERADGAFRVRAVLPYGP